MSATVNMPLWAEPLWKPARYKVLYGGRGSAKSWTVATYLDVEAARKPERILCCREFQKSIKESAHKLISDRIGALGLDSLFEIGESFIRSKCGSEFLFLGLRHNISQIKSLEGITKVWVEEAQTISAASWDVLIPTIRAPGSEFLVTFNPENDDDATFDMFINKAPPDAWVRKVNYDENPWFPPELEQERMKLWTAAQAAGAASPEMDKYRHIWGGECLKFAGGAIYGEFMVKAEQDSRITTVPYNPALPVYVSWDLGYSDSTALWFLQIVGKEPRCIDYLEDSLKALDFYVKALREKGYNYAMHILPHDAGHASLRTGKTLVAQLAEMGLGKEGRDLLVLPPDSVAGGIELVRQLIPQLWFDRDKCAAGIKALKKYQYEFDDERQKYRDTPRHDWTSHGCDSLRYMATHLATMRPIAKPQQYGYANGQYLGNSQTWMG